jgi:serine phosphatase RsbU (regulator of sigma subunit)
VGDELIGSIFSAFATDSICGLVVLDERLNLIFQNESAKSLAEVSGAFSDPAAMRKLLDRFLAVADSGGRFVDVTICATSLSGRIHSVSLNEKKYIALEILDATELVCLRNEVQANIEAVGNANENLLMLYGNLQERDCLRQIVTTVNDGLLVVNSDLCVLPHYSNASHRLLNAPEIVGKRVDELFYPPSVPGVSQEDRDRFVKAISNAFRVLTIASAFQELAPEQFDSLIQSAPTTVRVPENAAAREWRHLSLSMAPVIRDGHVDEIIITFTDITQMQRLTNRLHSMLICTKDLAVIRDRVFATRAAFLSIMDELPLDPEADAHVYFCEKDGLIASTIPLLNKGDFAQEATPVPVPETVDMSRLNAVLERGVPVLSEQRELILPISFGGVNRGVIVAGPYGKESLPADELDFASTVSSSLGIALENIAYIQVSNERAMLEAEMQAAKLVQEALLPSEIAIPGLDMCFSSVSAAQTGGDWYGYHYDRVSHRMYFYVGDVTGHGFPSALVTGVACGAIHSGEKTADLLASKFTLDEKPDDRLEHLARVLNEVVHETGSKTDRMMTMFFLCLDLSTGELTYINAAHPHPFLVRRSGNTVNSLVSSGYRLGNETKKRQEVFKTAMQPGDIVFLYTDGLVENTGPSGEHIAPRKLKQLIGSCASVFEIKEKVLTVGREVWQDNPPADDVSFLAFAWNGPVSRDTMERVMVGGQAETAEAP